MECREKLITDNLNSENKGRTMADTDRIDVMLVTEWDEEPIIELCRSAGWCKEDLDPAIIPEMIKGSYLFAVAVEAATGRSVGMGRMISDGIADAYIQDLIVLPRWRNRGIGRMIVAALLDGCKSGGITWIGLIAQPGTDGFYRSLGFTSLKGHKAMLFEEG